MFFNQTKHLTPPHETYYLCWSVQEECHSSPNNNGLFHLFVYVPDYKQISYDLGNAVICHSLKFKSLSIFPISPIAKCTHKILHYDLLKIMICVWLRCSRLDHFSQVIGILKIFSYEHIFAGLFSDHF